MSSAHSPTCGNSSLTSIPHWPYFLNANGDRISAPVFRSVATDAAGQRLAVVLVEHRLGIEAVDLRQPAVHEQEDDVLGARGDDRACARRARRAGRTLSGPAARAIDSPTRLGERQHAEAVANAAQRVAASQRRPDLCGAWIVLAHKDEFVRARAAS